MTSEEIWSAVLSVAGTVWVYVQAILGWIIEMLETLFGHIALAVSSWLSTLTVPMLPTFLKLFSNKTINLALFFAVLIFIIVINIISFAMFGMDKRKSQQRRARRIPERKLMSLCFWGGAGGGLLGMQIFRHKTQHNKFAILVPLMFALQLVIDSVLLGFLGFWAFF